jgi:hypothetical protein
MERFSISILSPSGRGSMESIWSAVAAIASAITALIALIVVLATNRQRQEDIRDRNEQRRRDDDQRQRDREEREQARVLRQRGLLAGVADECAVAASLCEMGMPKAAIPLWHQCHVELATIDAEYGSQICQYLAAADEALTHVLGQMVPTDEDVAHAANALRAAAYQAGNALTGPLPSTDDLLGDGPPRPIIQVAPTGANAESSVDNTVNG